MWLRSMPPPPTYSYIGPAEWTMGNTVVTVGAAPGPLLSSGLGNLVTWNFDHLSPPDAPSPTATIEIYNLGGTLNKTETKSPATIGYDSKFISGLAAGIYPFRVRVEHGLCGDNDKSSTKVGGGWALRLTPQIDKFYYWSIDPQASTMTGCVKYTLNRAAASCQVKFYRMAAGQAPAQIGNALTCTQLAAGTYYSPAYTIPVVIDVFGDLSATYYAAIFAQETAADGANNRDGQPKPALQHGSSQPTRLVDLDVDSDNDNRNGAPERSGGEDIAETTSPGKVFIINADNDGGGAAPDNSDQLVDGPSDSADDMAKVVCEVDPSWQSDGGSVVLSASAYTYIRVFRTNNEYIMGADGGRNQPYTFLPGSFTGGPVTLWVEGLDLGAGATQRQVTLSLICKTAGGQEFCRDEVLLTATNTLTTAPLSIPYYNQHKDTAMLCCSQRSAQFPDTECPPTGAGSHLWDRNHGQYLQACPHCNNYCTRASCQMINHHYGGGISQDRVSYASRGAFTFGGDLGHGHGLWPKPPLAWALGLDGGSIEEDQAVGSTDADWYQILGYLVSYRPVLCVIVSGAGLHSTVVVSFRLNAGVKQLQLHDPADGPLWRNFGGGADPLSINRICSPANAAVGGIVARWDEASVSAHSDADAVVDFDEEGNNRFTDFENWAGYQLNKTWTNSGGSPANDKQELDTYYHTP